MRALRKLLILSAVPAEAEKVGVRLIIISKRTVW
jgi:hypothetical protein